MSDPASRPIRQEIALSWHRSELSGLDPGAAPDIVPISDLDTASRLLRAATPVLDEIAIQIAGTGFCVLLADSDCTIVAHVFDDKRVERHMEKVGARLGSSFGEDFAGTNALGTPLETRQGIVINGSEHFLASLKGFSCYGHPIVNPATRRVEGILDMTSIAVQANPMFAPFLSRAASDIERRLLEGARVSQQKLVDAFARVSPQSHLAVTAIGDDILLSNRTAHDVLDAADHAVLRGLAADLAPDQSRTTSIELASGELADVRADRVAGADGGALFLVRPSRRPHTGIRRKRTSSVSAGARNRALLQKLRESTDAVAIGGEPGTGRTSAVRDIAGSRPVQWLDATRIALDGRREWMRELVDLARQGRSVVAIENIQLLPESVVPLVARLLGERSGARILLTSSPIAELRADVAALAARCPGQVNLTPIRQRANEFAEIATRILGDIAPGMRLTPSALEALAASDWPGNMTELAVLLRRLADDRVGNRIELTDLPDAYRTSRKVSRLAGRERAERQAIVDALHECGGNKVHAATQLGISRSTLYTRMRALEITS